MPEDFWGGFRLDPRRPEHARLRATDADRERAHQLLADAYADGRITRDELDTRADRLVGPITLGALVVLLADLAPTRPTRPPARTRVVGRELLVAVVASLICVLLWVVTGRGFFWPLWVIVYTGIPPLVTLVRGRTRTDGGKDHTG